MYGGLNHHHTLLAANAAHDYLNDTTNRILNAKPVIKKQRNSHKSKERTGVYTSPLIAKLETGQEITLFETNIGYGGNLLISYYSTVIQRGRHPYRCATGSPAISPLISTALCHYAIAMVDGSFTM